MIKKLLRWFQVARAANEMEQAKQDQIAARLTGSEREMFGDDPEGDYQAALGCYRKDVNAAQLIYEKGIQELRTNYQRELSLVQTRMAKAAYDHDRWLAWKAARNDES